MYCNELTETLYHEADENVSIYVPIIISNLIDIKLPILDQSKLLGAFPLAFDENIMQIFFSFLT